MAKWLGRRPAARAAGLLVLLTALTGMVRAAETGRPTAPQGETLAQACIGCHGERGVSDNPLVPSLAGQHPEYLVNALRAFQKGDRSDPMMSAIASQYPTADLRRLADYFAAQPYTRRPQETDPQKAARGRLLAAKTCHICHPDNGKESSYAEYPRLAGQNLPYLQKAMADILSHRRRVDPIMLGMILIAPPEELDNALHFFAAQSIGASVVSDISPPESSLPKSAGGQPSLRR